MEKPGRPADTPRPHPEMLTRGQSKTPRILTGASRLSEAATKDHLVQVVGLLNDQEWGQDRLFFLRTLTRLRHPDRWELIASLTDDPHIGAEATRMLNRRRT